MKFPSMNHDKEMKSISGLISINANIIKTLIEVVNYIDEEYLEINSIKEKDLTIINSDEKIAKNRFFELMKKGSIIQKLFYNAMETKIFCSDCNVTSFNFEYLKYFDIDLKELNSPNVLYDLIFKIKKENKRKRCSFCNKETDYKYEQFICEFSKILIVTFKQNNLDYYKKFNLSNNLNLSNKKDISYNLICFIEVISNLVYFKGNNNIWNKYLGNNTFETVESIVNLRPIILFYKLDEHEKININISNDYQNMININQINMNNINNNTNYKINMMNENFQIKNKEI